MKIIYSSIFLVIALFLSSCTEKQNPPLTGNRLNVLHYDLLKEQAPIKASIKLPAQTNLPSWPSSDVNKFAGSPSNIFLAKNLHFTKKFSPFSKNPHIAIINDVIYNYSNKTISAYQVSTNKKLWSVNPISKADRDDVLDKGSIAYNNGAIYLSSGGRDFIAFEAISGKELWRYRAPSVVKYIPTIKDNNIYISSIDNTLSCIGLDGKLIWRYDAPTYSLANDHIYNPNLVYEDKLVMITTGGDLVILNRYTGEEIVQVNLATTSIIGDGSLSKGPLSSPILEGHNLFILTGEGDLIKIDLANPQIAWRQNFSGARSFWVAEKTMFLLTEDNQLLAIEDSAGKIIWAIDLPKDIKKKSLENFYGPILAGDQLLLNNAKGDGFFFSPYDGKQISQFKTDISTNQAPIIVNDKAYFIGKNGSIAVWQ